MRYVNIPGTDLRPAAICLGTVTLGSAIDTEASFSLLDAYLALGGNLIDTASLYADWLTPVRSMSEKTIGQWLKLRQSRSRPTGYQGRSLPVHRLGRGALKSGAAVS